MLNLSRYEVKLDNFSGPLDLLLHLVKEKEMDLFDIKLTEITDQFLAYIREMEQLNIEIASEYLTMASYLVETKTKLVLPKEEVEIDDNYEKDSRDELINRLLEYKKIKEVSQYFKDQHQEGIQYLSKPRTIIKGDVVREEELPLSSKINIDKLTNSFLKMLERINATKPLESNVVITEISPEEMADRIMFFLLNEDKEWLLEDLLSNFDLSLQVFVACFIALLDLARHQKIEIEQYQHLEAIYIRKYMKKEGN
ncbi:MAG: chromosome partitioning protein [Spiroplasma poulsonii]|uniref:Segregation and condensation protein A n=1 Tax=Spiroplasma poulsonii TaxID=2138 RepID=A0A2P6FBV3_9MOLU|nr:segregation/condensation protein A [Spiroplasma poulsonii]KAF0851352.1 Segregation and condensation protein A [Spiroplasma poulsonii]MBW1241694.1 chromosome partitioning protein [Spiroplasma poulsonii]PQM30945.1 Segregation and condensation protein A [Spiroplasma poulsonii]PWF95939.1 Segregation and condensation protein A [Spiroplasma poulsonii]PWF98715.1 Segregation and condensation protein A [Spiroplasma poulsonii]